MSRVFVDSSGLVGVDGDIHVGSARIARNNIIHVRIHTGLGMEYLI